MNSSSGEQTVNENDPYQHVWAQCLQEGIVQRLGASKGRAGEEWSQRYSKETAGSWEKGNPMHLRVIAKFRLDRQPAGQDGHE